MASSRPGHRLSRSTLETAGTARARRFRGATRSRCSPGARTVMPSSDTEHSRRPTTRTRGGRGIATTCPRPTLPAMTSGSLRAARDSASLTPHPPRRVTPASSGLLDGSTSTLMTRGTAAARPVGRTTLARRCDCQARAAILANWLLFRMALHLCCQHSEQSINPKSVLQPGSLPPGQ